MKNLAEPFNLLFYFGCDHHKYMANPGGSRAVASEGSEKKISGGFFKPGDLFLCLL